LSIRGWALTTTGDADPGGGEGFMIGKFDPQLLFAEPGVLVVRGPVRWEAADAEKEVKIRATLKQNGQEDHCEMEFPTPAADATFPIDETWSMQLDTNKIVPGPVHAKAVATVDGDTIDSWNQPPELPSPITVI
jgi:hypothetical protein